MPKQKAHISSKKKEIVKSLAELLKTKKTILIASIKSIPASQFQEISKKLRGKAIIKVPKKNLSLRALEENPALQELKEQVKSDVAILFSDLDAFELAAELIQNKRPAKAKPGQIAPSDIEISAGPTDLLPGPALSELGNVGLQVMVENGKITIRKAKIIVKKGEKISPEAADVMNKLGIKPFSVGFTPLAAFDNTEKKFYTNIKIDREETLSKLKEAFGKALSFAVNIGYSSESTIRLIIQKAGRNAKALEKFNAQANKSEGEGK